MIQPSEGLKPNQSSLCAFTTLYLSIPSILFACGWLRSPYAMVTILLITFCMLFAVIDILRAVVWRGLFSKRHLLSLADSKARYISFVLVFMGLAAWLLLSGVGGFGFQNYDYKKHNALLMSLIDQNWPPRVTRSAPLVYYIGYYLPAGWIGRLVGWDWANIFQLFWTFVGVALSFIWFCKISNVDLKNRVARVFGLMLIFCMAGGLDIIGFYLLKSNRFDITTQIEWWAKYFQYSSQTTLMYWVPQHAIVAWLVTGMLVNSLYHPNNLKYLGLAYGFSILWSPLSVIGTTPFFVGLPLVYLTRQNRRYLFDGLPFFFHLSALWIGGINLIYIISNRYDFPIGFLWQFVKSKRLLVERWIEFWLIEFGLLTVAILLLFILGKRSLQLSDESGHNFWSRGWQNYLQKEFNLSSKQILLFLSAVLMLTILPIFKMGRGNDVVMRTSIPSLFIFWAIVSKIVIDTSYSVKIRLRTIFTIMIVIIIVGFYPSTREITRSINKYHFGPPAASSVDSIKNFDEPNVVHQMEGTESSIFYYRLIKR
jgi:hypothetical protein